MAKRGSISGMTHLEKILGGVVWAAGAVYSLTGFPSP